MAVSPSSQRRESTSLSMSSDIEEKFCQVLHSIPITKEEKELKSVLWVAEKVMAFAAHTFSKNPITQIVVVDIDSPNPAWSVPRRNLVYWNSAYLKIHDCPIDLQVFWLILEKMNVLSHQELQEANREVLLGGCSKNKYIKKIEQIEHQNALFAQKLIFLATKAGLIESKRDSFVPNSFETYFMRQQFFGHSESSSQAYDQLCFENKIPTTEFNGSFPISSSSLDEKTEKVINNLLKLKNFQEENGPKVNEAVRFMIDLYLKDADLDQAQVQKAVKILFSPLCPSLK